MYRQQSHTRKWTINSIGIIACRKLTQLIPQRQLQHPCGLSSGALQHFKRWGLHNPLYMQFSSRTCIRLSSNLSWPVLFNTKTCTSPPQREIASYSTAVLKVTIGEKTKGNSTKPFQSCFISLDVSSHTSMHAQQNCGCTYSTPTSQQKRGSYTVVADSSSLQQASVYNASWYIAYTSDFLNNAHRDSKHCKCVASLYKHMGKLQSAVTLILRCESKFPKVKSLVWIHSACP